MQDSTLKILDAALKSDASITPVERNRILKIARGESIPIAVKVGNCNEPPRIYSRSQAAQILGDKTPRFVDLLCRRGLLKKFVPKGNHRAIGVCGQSLRDFIEGTPAT